MRTRYYDLVAIPGGAGEIRVRFELENRTAGALSASNGHHLGWQIYDPETHTFITEGQWAPMDVNVPPGARQALETRLMLPEQDGPYRVYLSPLHDRRGWFYASGSPFVVIDAAIANGRAQITNARVTTLRKLRRAGLLRAIPK